MIDLEQLKRFEDSESSFALTKLEAKRTPTQVQSGTVAFGSFELLTVDTNVVRVYVGRGYDGVVTSAVLKVLDCTEDSTVFETEGGIYKLERRKL